MNKLGKVLSINISEEKGIKKSIENGIFKQDYGLLGDKHCGNHNRQVSLLSIESIDKIKSLGVEGLCTSKFTENITTQDIVLYDLHVGSKIKIGETIQEITQIGKECYSQCEIKAKVDCVMPKEVIFTKVVLGGKIRCNDKIEVIEYINE
ncbi:MAG TPA: MOSC domain-containing protein [Peptostreptococcaceae bacterium]|nr:MOSC domain-containing protein [Peptostreptococcaceae bacterium]